jgi:hypothetical protein
MTSVLELYLNSRLKSGCLVGLLPGEIWQLAAKMTVGSGLAVDKADAG